jgi:hypothetical protein
MVTVGKKPADAGNRGLDSERRGLKPMRGHAASVNQLFEKEEKTWLLSMTLQVPPESHTDEIIP